MRILFITATRIGDAVLSTGLLDHLAERYPHARITLACGPAAAAERIRDSETGFAAPDDEAFANCAMLLLTQDNVFEARSEQARELQRGRGWDEAAGDFEALFE